MKILDIWKFTYLHCGGKMKLVCLVCFLKIHRIVRRHQLQIHVQQKAVENSIDSNKPAGSKHDNQLRVQKLFSCISSSWFYATIHHFLFPYRVCCKPYKISFLLTNHWKLNLSSSNTMLELKTLNIAIPWCNHDTRNFILVSFDILLSKVPFTF